MATKRKDIVVSYRKKWDTEGCCYSQTLRIKEKLFNEIKKELPLLELSKNNFCYLTLTQMYFINNMLKLNLKDRNTVLFVKN